MAKTELLSLKPVDWKQAYQWFTTTETYTFLLFLRRAALAFDKNNVKKVYAVQLAKERYFVVEFQNYKIQNHIRITSDQFRDLKIISEFHPHEVNEDPVHKQVRSDYLRWSILRSPSLSFLLAMILLTILVAQLKAAWIDNIQEGFWLVSSYCAVKCSKEFAQFVVMLFYLHAVLGLSLFWGPLHYMATYRLHRLSAQRFFSLVEVSVLSILGLGFFFSSFEYHRIEEAAQMYTDYRRGDFGHEEDDEDGEYEEDSSEELASTAPPKKAPIKKTPASVAPPVKAELVQVKLVQAKPAQDDNPNPENSEKQGLTEEPVKTDTPTPIEPQDKS